MSPCKGLTSSSSTTVPGLKFHAVQISSAMSDGFINRSSGKPDWAHESVKVAPGKIDVTRMPKGFNSSLKTLLIPNNPNFDMQYEPPLV